MIVEIRKAKKVGGSWYNLIPKYVFDSFADRPFICAEIIPYSDEPFPMFAVVFCPVAEVQKLKNKKFVILDKEKLEYKMNVKEEELTMKDWTIVRKEQLVNPDIATNIILNTERKEKMQELAKQDNNPKQSEEYDLEI